jgi:hypothetical protein
LSVTAAHALTSALFSARRAIPAQIFADFRSFVFCPCVGKETTVRSDHFFVDFSFLPVSFRAPSADPIRPAQLRIGSVRTVFWLLGLEAWWSRHRFCSISFFRYDYDCFSG